MVATNNKSTELQALGKKVLKFGIIGGLMTGGGGLVIFLFPFIINTILDFQLVIKEGNQFTKGWQNVPVPITTKIHIWNLENPNEFERGAKPRLREMGPYVYSTHMRKDIISWGPNQESVKYWIYITWYFDAERSVGRLNDRITLINMPAYTAAGVVKNIVDKVPLSFALAPVVFGFMNAFFLSHGERIITRTTPQKLIEGSHLGMVRTVNLLLKPFKWLGIEVPGTDKLKSRVPHNKFGLLHMLNNSRMGPYEIWTGQSDPKKFDKFISFGGKTVLDTYSDPKCNLINGTEGITFGSFLNKEDKLYLFFGDACRSLYATYKGLSHVRGIPTWRYRLPPSLLASPDKNPDNKCFCTTPKNYEKCDGIFDLGPCQMGAPLAFSFPHLLYTGKLIQDGVKGLSPDPDKHEAYFDINPILGIPVDGKVRLQMNVLVKPIPRLSGFGKIPEIVLPFVWLEIGVGVGGAYEWLMRFGTYGLLIADWGPYFTLFGGLGFWGYASYLLIKNTDLLFKPKPRITPLESFVTIDKQMATKAQNKGLYPNLFDMSGKTAKSGPILQFIPIVDNNINRRDRLQTSRLTSPIKGIRPFRPNPEQGRMRLSPPGTVE